MSHSNKEDVLRQIRENDQFKEILKLAKDDSERKAIKAYTESFISVLYQNVFSHIERAIAEDPEALKKSLQEINDELIKNDGTKA